MGLGNRLYIYDPENHEAFCLATSDGAGDGWTPGGSDSGSLARWLSLRDFTAATSELSTTTLRLVTVEDLPHGATVKFPD